MEGKRLAADSVSADLAGCLSEISSQQLRKNSHQFSAMVLEKWRRNGGGWTARRRSRTIV